MKKTQTIEVIGIGNFSIFPIKIKADEYKKVDEKGNLLFKQEKVKGTRAEYIYVDDKGKEYPTEKVFTDFKGMKIQQIKRTEKVKNFEIVDKLDIYNLTEYGLSFLNTDETTLNIFNEKIKDKAICFNIKKSTIGFNFFKAYILKLNGVLVMVTGKGNLNQAVTDFKEMVNNKVTKTEIVLQKVEIKADEIDDLINV